MVLIVMSAATLFGAGAFTRLVSANATELQLTMSSLPGLPAAATVPSLSPAAPSVVRQANPGITGVGQQAQNAAPVTSVASGLAATNSIREAPAGSATPPSEESASEQRVAALRDEDAGASAKSDGAEAQAEPPPQYHSYVVQPGDTVSGIAALFGVGTRDIVANNVGVISDQSLLLVGASLQVPTVPGILHNVRVGETLADIAEMYGVTLDDIVGFAGNQIGDPSNVLEGTQILVVNGTAPASAAVEATAEASGSPAAVPEPAVRRPLLSRHRSRLLLPSLQRLRHSSGQSRAESRPTSGRRTRWASTSRLRMSLSPPARQGR